MNIFHDDFSCGKTRNTHKWIILKTIFLNFIIQSFSNYLGYKNEVHFLCIHEISHGILKSKYRQLMLKLIIFTAK